MNVFKVGFLESPIAKNLTVLVSGTVLGQLVFIGFQLIVRRLFSPQDFGAFAVYLSVIGIMSAVSSLRYEQTIILPKDDGDGYLLLILSIFLTFITSLMLGIYIILFRDSILRLLKLPYTHSSWLYFIPLSILFFCIYQSLNYYLIRNKKFGISASNKIFRRSSEGLIQCVFGNFGIPFGLPAGDLIGHISNIIRTLFVSKQINLSERSFSLLRVKDLAWRYKAFPIKNAIPSLMNALSLFMPILLINRLFDQETTGYFDLARVVLIIPISLITTSLSQVLLQRLAEKRNKRQSVKKELAIIFIALLVSALVFIFTIKVFGVALFKIVFGAVWSESGEYAQILVWIFACKFIVSPFNSIYTAFEKIGIGSLWQTLYFFMILSLYWLPVTDIRAFLYNYMVIELLANGISFILDFGIILEYERKLRSI